MTLELLADCKHKLVFDPEAWEVACEFCGMAIPVFEDRARKFAPAGARLSSPSVKGNGSGTDQDRTIYELSHNHDPRVKDFEGRRTVRQLSGGIRFLADGRRSESDEGLVVELSNRLHGRVSDSDLTIIAALFRKNLAQLEKERRRRARQLLDQMTGNGHG